MRITASGLPLPVPALFFASGAAALGYEVLWARQLARVLGGSTSAIAFVVALFMGGMGIGYALGGRLAPRVRRPVGVYGIVEVAMAIAALGIVHALPSLEGASASLAYLAAGAAILPCTILAGLTLPLLVESTRGAVGAAMGGLYAINTAGAVLGVLVVGTWSIGALGIRGSAWMLSVVGALSGACAWWLGRTPRGDEPLAGDEPSAGDEPLANVMPRLWLVLAAAMGVASLAEEVLWTRALIARFNASTYAMSAILAVFLLGLAGGAGYAARIVRRARNVPAWLASTQIVAGAIVMVTPELLVGSEYLLPGYVGVAQIGSWGAWLQAIGLGLGRVALVLLPPTLLLGFGLPLMAHLFAEEAGVPRARAVGMLTSANAFGAVVGSSAARLVLLPGLGLGNGLRALALVHALIAAAVLWRMRGQLPRGVRSGFWAAFPIALVVGVLARATPEPIVGRLSEGHELLFIDEGVQDTTAVVQVFDGSRHIFSNGVAYAGDQGDAQTYMRLLGHLPAIRARTQERALVICLGTGMTAAAVAKHPFETIDLVDISPVVHRTLPYFDSVNDRVYADPRVQIHIADGRVFMARAQNEQYDVITLEPPPPRAAGVAALYSIEFYESARRLLREGGAVAQWLPMHGMSHAELEMLTRTFFEVFPRGEVVEMLDNEAALIATRGEGAPSGVRQQRAAIADAHLGFDVLALPVASADRVAREVADADLVTDDQPRIEHFVRSLRDENPQSAAQRFRTTLFHPGT